MVRPSLHDKELECLNYKHQSPQFKLLESYLPLKLGKMVHLTFVHLSSTWAQNSYKIDQKDHLKTENLHRKRPRKTISLC